MVTTASQQRMRPPAAGILANVDAVDIPPMQGLASAQNWIFRNGKFVTRPGLDTFTNAQAGFVNSDFVASDFALSGVDFSLRPMGIYQYDHQDGTTRTVAGTRAYWYKLDPGTQTWVDITGPNQLTGSNVSHVRFKGFSKAGETWLLGVNGANTPKVWDGDTPTYRDMGGNPPIATAVGTIANRVLLGNLSSGPNASPVAITWSSFNNFDAGWDTDVALLAETPGHIQSIEELSSLSSAIYKTDAIYVVSASGGIDPFRFELRRAYISGPASPASVVHISDGSHVYRAADGSLNRFDGGQIYSMSDASQSLFVSLARSIYMDRTWLMYDPRHGEVWTFLVDAASNGDPNVAIVDILSDDGMRSESTWLMRWAKKRFSAGRIMNVQTGLRIGEMVGTIGEQLQSIGEFASRVDRMGLCSTAGIIYEDTGIDDIGEPIPAHFEYGLMDLDYPGYKDVVESGHYFARTSQPQEIRVRVGSSTDGALPIFSDADVFDISEPGPYVVGHRTSGRLMSLRVEADAVEPLQWRGGFLGMIPRGLR